MKHFRSPIAIDTETCPVLLSSLNLSVITHFDDSAPLGILFGSMDQGKWGKTVIVLVLVYYLTESETAGVYHLCGIHLVDALLLVCEGKGIYYRNFKGPVHSQSHRFVERNKKKFGIVEKCCHQSCTLYDLQTYCKT
ncbi:insulin-like [Hyla sarda]|uniref:insulin-like n=1 Tax=Hyla sarda TaxID=327740 RepID=UPI0024C44D19|nr:insulin-like [Hyla sarda]